MRIFETFSHTAVISNSSIELTEGKIRSIGDGEFVET